MQPVLDFPWANIVFFQNIVDCSNGNALNFWRVNRFYYLEFPGGLLTATIFPDISFSYQQTQEP
jgi:hypothetical protein